MKSMCWDTHAMDSIIKSGQKDTEASIHHTQVHIEISNHDDRVPTQVGHLNLDLRYHDRMNPYLQNHFLVDHMAYTSISHTLQS